MLQLYDTLDEGKLNNTEMSTFFFDFHIFQQQLNYKKIVVINIILILCIFFMIYGYNNFTFNNIIFPILIHNNEKYIVV